MNRSIQLGNIEVGTGKPLLIIAGPCVIEDQAMMESMALTLKEVAEAQGFSYVFKASYDKANRTSLTSYRGPGLKKGLEILADLKMKANVPVISDIHSADEVAPAAEVLDILQIPAFLCRQTDLITAAAQTGKPINLKKGQFLSPWDIEHVAAKAAATGNRQIILTERGVSFGYNNLVVDMRSFPIMRGFGYPVVFDATHSVQLPGGGQGCSGGDRRFIAPLLRAAVAAGVDGVFLEVHPDPDRAKCDGPNSLPLNQFSELMKTISQIDRIVKSGGETC